MSEPHAPEAGVFQTATRLLRTLRAVAGNRIELFLLEVQEERIRIFDALFLLAAGLVCIMMTLIMVTFAVVIIFWDTHRLLVLGLLVAGYAVGALWALSRLRSLLRNWQAFSATLDQIKKDSACFKETN
jgi:uncharacterized membrane protein YqjE